MTVGLSRRLVCSDGNLNPEDSSSDYFPGAFWVSSEVGGSTPYPESLSLRMPQSKATQHTTKEPKIFSAEDISTQELWRRDNHRCSLLEEGRESRILSLWIVHGMGNWILLKFDTTKIIFLPVEGWDSSSRCDMEEEFSEVFRSEDLLRLLESVFHLPKPSDESYLHLIASNCNWRINSFNSITILLSGKVDAGMEVDGELFASCSSSSR